MKEQPGPRTPIRSPARRRTLRALALAVASAAYPAAHVSLAPAHAIVVDSDPPNGAVLERPPTEVRLRFNSKIERRLSRLTVVGPNGRPVPLAIASSGPGDAAAPDRLVAPLPLLPAGAYAVRWRVLAADGHITEGTLRFTVKPGS